MVDGGRLVGFALPAGLPPEISPLALRDFGCLRLAFCRQWASTRDKMELGPTGPDHIVRTEPDASEPTARITQLNEDCDVGVKAQRVAVAPFLPVCLPLHASQDGDLGPRWSLSCRQAVDHILIVRHST